MGTLKVIVLILDLISAILLTAIILIQSGKSAGLSGAIAGASDSFMAKGGTKTLDTKLAKATKWIGLAFVILSLFAVILVSATANKTPAADTDTTASTVETVDTTGDTAASGETGDTAEAVDTTGAADTEAPETEGTTEAATTTEAN